MSSMVGCPPLMRIGLFYFFVAPITFGRRALDSVAAAYFPWRCCCVLSTAVWEMCLLRVWVGLARRRLGLKGFFWCVLTDL